MEEWKTYRVSDICHIKHGYAFKGDHFCDKETHYIATSPGNFEIGGGFKLNKPKYYNGPIPTDYILQPDDLLVTMTDLSKAGDTLGYSALVPKSDKYVFLHNQRIGLVQDIHSDIDKHFLYWIMRTYAYQRFVVGHCSGTTVKHTSPSNIGLYTFRAPSLQTQRRIARTLDSLESKIELNNRINHNLEEQAQALYKSWFVDFEPFKDGKFVESELGMIPERWHLGTLSDVATVVMGQSPSGTSFNEEGKGIAFYQGRTEFGNRFPSIRLFTTEPTRFAEQFSVLLSVRAPVGDINVAKERCCIGRGLASIFGKFQSYVFYTVNSLRPAMDRYNGEGTVFGSINRKDLENLQIIVPTSDAEEQFNKIAEKLDAEIFDRSMENLQLVKLRDSLLPKLMSGELNINELGC